jgi:hypothetical protein
MAAKVLGKQWQGLDDDVRELWRAKARERKAEHLKMYPGYQYTPRKQGEKKHRATRKDTKAGGDEGQYEKLQFITQESDLYMCSEYDSGDGADDMEMIGTKVDEGLRCFHMDGEGDIAMVLPAANTVNITKMVDAHNKRAELEDGTAEYNATEENEVWDSIPPHVQNDTSFFEALIDWDGIAEDFQLVQQASGEDLAGLRELETGNPYLSLSDEDQRALFEAELERTLKFFD